MKFFRFFILGVLFFGSLFLLKNVFAAITVPLLSSPTAVGISSTTATLGATITAQGNSTITARGTCWGTSSNPTSNCVAQGGTAVGTFTQSRAGLSPSNLYYYRGYATNSSGTGYSPTGTFTTLAGPTSTIVTASPTTYNTQVNTNISFTYSVNFNVNGYPAITECRLLNQSSSALTSYVPSTSQNFRIVYSSPSSSGTSYYYIQCQDAAGEHTATSAMITVNIPAPTVTVKANGQNPLTVNSGAEVKITWDTTNNPSSCTYNGSPVSVYGYPGFIVYPTTTTTYTIICSN